MNQKKHVLIVVGGWGESDPSNVQKIIAAAESKTDPIVYHCIAYSGTVDDVVRSECLIDLRKGGSARSGLTPSNWPPFVQAASGIVAIPLTEAFDKIALGCDNNRESAYDTALILTNGLVSAWKPERHDSINVTTSIRNMGTHVIAIHMENPDIQEESDVVMKTKQSLRHATNQVCGISVAINKDNVELAGILHVSGMVMRGALPVRRDVERKYGKNSLVLTFYQKCVTAFQCK